MDQQDQQDERLEPFQRLDKYVEPAEVTLTPAANHYGGGSAIPADTAAPVAQYLGGSIPPNVAPPTSRPRFVCDGREAPIGQADSILSGTRRERRVPVGIARRPRRRGAGRPGHRRTTSTRAGPDDDGPEPEPPPRRRYTVDSRYVVVAVVG